MPNDDELPVLDYARGGYPVPGPSPGPGPGPQRRMSAAAIYARWYSKLWRENAALRDQVQLLVAILKEKGVLSAEEAMAFLPVEVDQVDQVGLEPVDEGQLVKWLEQVKDEGEEPNLSEVLMEIARAGKGEGGTSAG